MGKVHYITNWDEWKEFCTEQNIDPYENADYGFDLGGGDSFDIEYIGDYPKPECSHKKTVCLNEEGNVGIFCVDCGEQLEKEC